jgi:RNA polymerase sigma-70 factor (ECF subfamily)
VLLDVFMRGLGREAPVATAEQRERLDAALRKQIARGQAAHEGIAVADEEVAAMFGEIAGGDAAEDLDALHVALESIPADDVVLALACARGHDGALARFRDLYMGNIPAVARRVGTANVDAAEVLSRVSEALFVAAPGGRPRILDLVARGSLSGLVKVIAVRTTINLCRSERREVTDPQHALATAIASQTDPELATIKQHHRSAVKAALEAAVASLPPDERNLLRLSLLHRLTVDEIASLQQVHRSTAARRLAKIRERLGKEARRRLRVDLGATGPELEHVFHLVRSSLHVSFERLLGS